MLFKFQGKDTELSFGVGFVRKLDKKYFVQREGIDFGLGLHLAYPGLMSKNVSALSDVIRCALPGQVSETQVDKAIDAYADENGGLAPLFAEVVEGLKTSNTLKDTLAVILETVETTEAKN